MPEAQDAGIEVTKSTTVTSGPAREGAGDTRALALLFAGIVLFSLALIGVEIFFRTESDIFQVFSNCLSAFVGAFLLWVKPPSQK